MDYEKFRKIQNTQLEIMDAIHSLCVSNNLKYYMIGGTLLGSVRHKGYIPWDPDIDIAMPREDYNRLKDICANQLPARFKYYDYTVKKNYAPPHALIALGGSRIKRSSVNILEKFDLPGIYIDIFPLDGVPQDVKLQDRQANRIKRIKCLKILMNPTRYAKNSSFFVFLKRLTALFLSIIPMQYVNHLLNKEMSRYSSCSYENLCSMASHYSYKKQNMPKEVYGTPVLMPFENRMYYGVQMYDSYLTRIYKNYMELPSLEEQQKMLNFFSEVEWQIG